MIPFVESRVKLSKEFSQSDFDKIASRLGLKGYVILSNEKSQLKLEDSYLEHYTRFEFKDEKQTLIRNKLPLVRNKHDIVSVKTIDAKVAQWVVKDNRVDIVTIPMKFQKEIIIQPFANVAANNETFIELDISGIFQEFQTRKKSVLIRTLSRTINILLKEKTSFILTTNVKEPLDFRNIRSILSIGKIFGIPDEILKKNYKLLSERLLLNRKKLSKDFVSPDVWLDSEKQTVTKQKSKPNNEIIEEYLEFLEIPDSIKDYQINKKKLERQRYILFEILSYSDIEIEEKEFLSIYWDYLTKLYGEVGCSRAGAYLISYNPQKRIGILRCSNYSLNASRVALALITEFANAKIHVNIMKISGTLKNLIQIKKKKEKN